MPTNWDPAHTNAAIALSGSNLTATSSAGSGSAHAAVYATTAISATTKQYFEVTVSGVGTPGGAYMVGVMNGSASLSTYLAATNGVGWGNNTFFGSSQIYRNGTNPPGTFPVLANGQTLCVAIDRGANRMWFAINRNTWAGSVIWMGDTSGNENPAAGTGSLDISAVTGTVFPAFSSAWTGDVATANFGATAFAFTPPAGFVGLDSGAAGGTTQARVAILA